MVMETKSVRFVKGRFAKAAAKLGFGKVICGLPQTQSVLCFVQGKMLLT